MMIMTKDLTHTCIGAAAAAAAAVTACPRDQGPRGQPSHLYDDVDDDGPSPYFPALDRERIEGA